MTQTTMTLQAPTQMNLGDLIKDSEPTPFFQGFIWGTILKRRRADAQESLPRHFVKAYQRPGRKPYILFYPTQDSFEPQYMLDLDKLHAVVKEERSQCCSYLYCFGHTHRINTGVHKVRARKYVLICKLGDKAVWDAMLQEPSHENLKKRKLLKRKIKNAFHKGHMLKHMIRKRRGVNGKDFQLESSDSGELDDDDQDPEIPDETSPAAVHSIENHEISFVPRSDEKRFDTGSHETDEGEALSPASKHTHSGCVYMLNQTESGTLTETDSQVLIDTALLVQSPDNHSVCKSVMRFGTDDEQMASSDTSRSIGELEEELRAIDEIPASARISDRPIEAIQAIEQVYEPGKPPFRTFEELIMAPEELRFISRPTAEEFSILLDVEKTIDQNKMIENDWEVALDRNYAPIATMWRKKLPQAVSSTLLLAGRFVDIDCPPELVYFLVGDNSERTDWDTNIVTLKDIEYGEDYCIEHSVMATQMGFASREFLKYRLFKAEYKEYPYMMLLRSCERDDVPVGKGNVRAVSVINGYVIRASPTNPNKTRMTILANTDIKGLIPTWAVNAVSSRMPPKWVSSLETAASKFQKKHNIQPGQDLSQYLAMRRK